MSGCTQMMISWAFPSLWREGGRARAAEIGAFGNREWGVEQISYWAFINLKKWFVRLSAAKEKMKGQAPLKRDGLKRILTAWENSLIRVYRKRARKKLVLRGSYVTNSSGLCGFLPTAPRPPAVSVMKPKW